MHSSIPIVIPSYIMNLNNLVSVLQGPDLQIGLNEISYRQHGDYKVRLQKVHKTVFGAW